MKAILARKYGSPDALTLEQVDRPIDVYVKNLTPDGRMVSVGALAMNPMEFMAKMGSYKESEEVKVFNYMAQFNTDDLITLAHLMESGEVKSVIDRTFLLEKTAAAMAMQGSQQISGKVVIVIHGDDPEQYETE